MFRRAGERAPERLVPYDVDRPAVEAARRDPRRFEPLYRKYVGQVYSFAVYELHDHHAAEDLTAQVFLQALSGLPGFRERPGERRAGEGASSFRVWLFRIARNAVSNERRRLRRHPASPLG
ncbi:MAG: RNA polymerase sigma factor, partial [Candidatus Limnocylindrales bacterium]